jgi:uncharacterized RDD family membrane protein YckC
MLNALIEFPALVGLITSQIVAIAWVLFLHKVVDTYRMRFTETYSKQHASIIASIRRRVFAAFLDIGLIYSIFFLHIAIFSVINGIQPAEPHIFFGTISFTYCYYGYAWTNRYGQTIGKRLMAIKIVKKNGKQMKLFDAVLRFWGIILGVLTFYVGFIWVFVDKNNQSWHDKIAGTLVVMDC